MGRGRGRGGGRGGRGGKRQHSGGGGRQDRNVRPRTDAWCTPQDIESNGLFEEYYKEQGVCPPEEWDAFILALKTQLPITFRINGQGQFADRLRQKLETDFMAQFRAAGDEALVIDGEPVEAPHPLDWYPDRLAWQMNFSRTQLRKLPVLEALHEFLKRENETGSITRQEAVSMVPPLFLEVEPHHWVLDMCAAPGSKTFQLLEMLHAGPAPATGLVVANDADVMRCNLLSHQTKRMCSPALVVTNHEAQAFPLLRNRVPGSTEKHVLFDRILCDVPCSGDGTMRKAPDIWRRWSTSSGNGLHSLQLRITLRACELLRVGGRLVYSTCTFNPVEDEAVVAEVLRRTKGAFELLDMSGQLAGLKRLPGMQRWRVRDRERWYNNWEEAKQGYKLDPTMFPDDKSDGMPLHRCMRFLPHHQNTGGFFVAVLRKVGELEGPLAPVSLEHRATRGEEAKEQQQQEGQEEGAAEAAGTAQQAGAEPMDSEGQQHEQLPAGEAADAPQEAAAAEAEEEQAGEAPGEAAGEDGADAAAAAGTAAEDGENAGNGADEGAGKEGGQAKAKGWWQRKREAEMAAELAKGLPEWGIRGGGGRNREGGGKFRGIDPIVPYVDSQQLLAIRSFYGLSPDCPVPHALIARSTDARPKKLQYVSEAVKLLLRLDAKEHLKIIGAGVKILERQDSKDGLVPCLYRFAQDGLPVLLPHVTKQRFHPTVQEMLALLQYRSVALPEGFRMHITKGKVQGQEGQAAAATNDTAVPDEGAPEGPAGEPTGQTAEQQTKQEQEAEEGADAPQQQQQQKQPDVGGSTAAPAAASAAAPAGTADPKQQQQQRQHGRFTLSDPQTLEELRDVAMGCCVALLRPQDVTELGLEAEGGQGAESGLASAAPLAVACWRGRGTLNVLVSKQEAAQMVEKIREAQSNAAAVATAGAEATAAGEGGMKGEQPGETVAA